MSVFAPVKPLWKAFVGLVSAKVVHENSTLTLENAELANRLSEKDEQIRALKEEVRLLKEELQDVRKPPKLEKREGVYWSTDPAALDPGPFCPTCYQKNGGVTVPLFASSEFAYQCPACNTVHQTHDPQPMPPDPDRPRRSSRTGY